MSLLPPPSAAKFRRSPPSTTSSPTAPAASTSGAASASASHISFPLNNVSSRSIQRRFVMAAAGKGPIEPYLPFSSLSLDASASPDSASLTASVASPPSISLTRWNLDHRHIFVLYCTACVAAISASWLFFSAIPALLAFKRAAGSLEKLLDVTAEELPDTMAAVRLSGMEISNLTMELSDLGQEITKGVRSSTRAIRIAEDRLRHLSDLTTMAPIVPVQGKTAQKDETKEPVVARAARNMREGITKGRAIFGGIFSVMQISWRAFNFLVALGRKRAG